MRIFLFCLCLLAGFGTTAQTNIHLKITYNNQAVCRYDVTIKAGGGTVGKGVTDDNGEISVSSPVNVKDVDVHGIKKTANGEKKFDIQGYVRLDDDGYAHIQMENLVKEMASGSGLPESMMAAAWGLTDLDCGGTSSSGSGGSNTDEGETSGSGTAVPALPSREESLAMQEQGFRNEIANLDRKIDKSEREIEKLKAAGADPTDIRLEELNRDEMKWKRERKMVGLEKVQKMQQGPLSAADKASFNQREEGYKAREQDAQDEQKELKEARKKSGTKSSGGGSVDRGKLKREAAVLRMEVGTLKTQAKLRENALEKARTGGKATPEEIAKKETDLAETKAKLAEAEARLAEYDAILAEE